MICTLHQIYFGLLLLCCTVKTQSPDFQSTKQLTPHPPTVQTSRTIAGEQF